MTALLALNREPRVFVIQRVRDNACTTWLSCVQHRSWEAGRLPRGIDINGGKRQRLAWLHFDFAKMHHAMLFQQRLDEVSITH